MANEAGLWKLKARGDAEARGLLVQRYVRLGEMLARRYMRTSKPLDVPVPSDTFVVARHRDPQLRARHEAPDQDQGRGF